MKRLLLFLILLIYSCSTIEPLNGNITWDEVAGYTWSMIEDMNTEQKVILDFTFLMDTLYLLKTYYDPATLEINYYKYMKGRVFNKRYEKDHVGDVDLFFTWARKHYADEKYKIPVEGYDLVDDWFLWKIDKNNNLLMGIVDPPNTCYYWTLEKKKNK